MNDSQGKARSASVPRRYEVFVCPLCGEQLEVDGFYGDGHCSEHGKVAPLTVEAAAIGPATAPAWLVKNGVGRPRWELTDPTTQTYSSGRTPKVLDTFTPDGRQWRCETCDVIATPAPGHTCWDAGHPHVVVKP